MFFAVTTNNPSFIMIDQQHFSVFNYSIILVPL